MSDASIRFFNDREVRAAWDDENNQWWFSVVAMVNAIMNCGGKQKARSEGMKAAGWLVALTIYGATSTSIPIKKRSESRFRSSFPCAKLRGT
jgi:hypothetical protein